MIGSHGAGVQLSSRKYSENQIRPVKFDVLRESLSTLRNVATNAHEAALQINGDAACVSMADLRRLDESASAILYNRKLARCSAGDHSNDLSEWVCA